MSRVGKEPIIIPDKVKVSIQGQHVEVQGPLGKLSLDMHKRISAKINDKTIVFERLSDDEEDKSLHGMERARVYNFVYGVSHGFSKYLTLIGVGYRAQLTGDKLNLQLGFSHPIIFDIPQGIKVKVDKQTAITLTGADKEQLGLTAARIRSLRPPEPYKGKGIRYTDEHVLRKAGKAAVASGKK